MTALKKVSKKKSPDLGNELINEILSELDTYQHMCNEAVAMMELETVDDVFFIGSLRDRIVKFQSKIIAIAKTQT